MDRTPGDTPPWQQRTDASSVGRRTAPEEQRHQTAWLTEFDAFCVSAQDGGQP